MELELEQVLRVKFYAKLISQDTRIYEVAALRHYSDITGRAKLLTYTGPPYAMFNSSSNCTIGIWELKKGRLYGACTEPNYRDSSLDRFEVVNGTDAYVASQAESMVFVGPLKAYIQCFKYRIQIRNREFLCPYHPFALDIHNPFKILDMDHQVVHLDEVKLAGQVKEVQSFSPEETDNFR